MSLGTLQSVGVGAHLTSAMPFRILNKGPEYFRRQDEGGARRPSAVERLEGRASKSSLNLDILNNLINICDSPLTSPRADVSPWQELETPRDPSKPKTPTSQRAPSTSAVRRVDVRPGDPLMPLKGPDIVVTSVTASPIRSGFPTNNSLYSPICSPTDPGKRQTTLQRSKSDLSDRYSRASADLERFFNYCGLDPGEVTSIGAERFARASSDIVSLKFHSVSAESSECVQSQISTITAEETSSSRIPYGVSIIERNARVIKWLYGLRQARDAQKMPV
uniref:Family with sequence similarity 110 member A n=1 Tax=Leptobrachium leishanense TaxID=445787 RepID=A0A8C5MHH5_9ANUR